jgi:hypothetical protein
MTPGPEPLTDEFLALHGRSLIVVVGAHGEVTDVLHQKHGLGPLSQPPIGVAAKPFPG